MPLIATRAAVRRRRWHLAARAHGRAVSPPATEANAFALAQGAIGCGHLAVQGPRATVRRRAPVAFPSRVFGRPLLLRSLFEHDQPLRAIAEMLAASSIEEAAAAADRLMQRSWTPEQAQALRMLRAIALGETPLSTLWGEDAAADALALRSVRAAPDRAPHALGWGLFLQWAGGRLADAPLGKLPPALARVATASLAAARGYRGAFEALAGGVRVASAFGDPLSLVALRCALGGVFLPPLVAFLLPQSRRRSPSERDPWSAALLALHAYHDQHNVAGIVHLTAALVAADVRERILTFAGRDTAALLRRRWWSRPPPEADRALGDAVLLLRVQAHVVERAPLNPWPREWGGPDVAAVVHAAFRLVGRKGDTLGLEVFLDDRLAVAALFAAIGYAPSAEAQLAQAEVPPALAVARRAVAAALTRLPATAEASAVLKEGPWGAQAGRLFQRLRTAPEPSVELGSPHWLLGETRGTLMSRLVAEGRFEAARAVRPVLDRADLRRDLEPYWILRGSDDDTAAVAGLARWLAARERTRLDEVQWIRYAEDVCRRLRPERPAGGGE